MQFIPLYYQDRIQILHNTGHIGILTLWTPVPKALSFLQNIINLDNPNILAISNFYGQGLHKLLRNLLYNPQITHLLIFGQDLSNSKQELLNFFQLGLENTTFLGQNMTKIINTNKFLDDKVLPNQLNITVQQANKISDPNTKNTIQKFFQNLPNHFQHHNHRINTPLAITEIKSFPSNPLNHSISRNTQLQAYVELLFIIHKFGIPKNIPTKGKKYELQNLKVTINQPQDEDPKLLQFFQAEHKLFKIYQQSFLSPNLNNQPYTYGNRINQFFNINSLNTVINRLNQNNDDRHCFISLWHNQSDLTRKHHRPCLVSLYFKTLNNKLNLTASFRTHNAGNAWLQNAYGMLGLLQHVSNHTNIKIGSLTIFSHSISLSEDALNLVKIAQSLRNDDNDQQLYIDNNQIKNKRLFTPDPNGNFTFTIDYQNKQVVAEHSLNGITLKQYKAHNFQSMTNQLLRDKTVSNLHHAFYIAQQLTKLFQQLNKNHEN